MAAAACQDQGRRARAGLCGRGASGGPAAAPCQHRCDSCDEWAKEPPQRHTVPDCQHMALLRTAEKQQQQRRQQTDLRPASVGRGGTTPHCATRGSRQPAARSCQQQLPPPAKSHPYVRIVWTGTSGHTGVLSQLGQREGPRSPPVGACLRRAVSGSAVSLSTRLLPRAFRSARLCFTATLGTRAAVMVNSSPERLGTYPPRAPHGEAPPSWVPGSFPNADVSRRNRHH